MELVKYFELKLKKTFSYFHGNINWNLRFLLIMYWTAFILGPGCSKTDPNQIGGQTGSNPYTTGSNPSDSRQFPTPNPNPGGNGKPVPNQPFPDGGTADFYPDSFEIFNTYVIGHPLNAPKNIQINVNLKNQSAVGAPYNYAGVIKIAYDDAGVRRQGTFVANEGVNVKISGLNNNNWVTAIYNYWFGYKKSQAFVGYFQDNMGSIVLSIDNSGTQADAEGNILLSGSVWFKNFPTSFVTSPNLYRQCWFLTNGPFNCQSSIINNKSGISPSDTYQRLGTFRNLPKRKAFH